VIFFWRYFRTLEKTKIKQIIIENALQPKSDEEIAAVRRRLEALYDTRTSEFDSLYYGYKRIVVVLPGVPG